MKKIVLALLVCVLMAGIAWGAIESREEQYTRTKEYVVCDSCQKTIKTYWLDEWADGVDSYISVLKIQEATQKAVWDNDTALPVPDVERGMPHLYFFNTVELVYTFCDVKCLGKYNFKGEGK